MLNGLNNHMDTAEESEDGRTCRNCREEQPGSMSAKSGEGTCVSQDLGCGPCRRHTCWEAAVLDAEAQRSTQDGFTPGRKARAAVHTAVPCCPNPGSR